jgi:hypothetical protein
VVGPVTDLVDTILGILPTPAPRNSSTSKDCKVLGLLKC